MTSIMDPQTPLTPGQMDPAGNYPATAYTTNQAPAPTNLAEAMDQLDPHRDLQRPVIPDALPGVYTRPYSTTSGSQTPGPLRSGKPNDLDMLWANSPIRHLRDDRVPALFIVLSFLAGVVLTSAVFFLLSQKPTITTDANDLTKASPVEAPIVFKTEEAKPASKPAENSAAKGTDAKPTTASATTAPTTTTDAASGKTTVAVQTYTVKSGDTLMGIALKVYNSAEPELLQKIQRANNMKSPHALQLDQQLVLPPKSYE